MSVNPMNLGRVTMKVLGRGAHGPENVSGEVLAGVSFGAPSRDSMKEESPAACQVLAGERQWLDGFEPPNGTGTGFATGAAYHYGGGYGYGTAYGLSTGTGFGDGLCYTPYACGFGLPDGDGTPSGFGVVLTIDDFLFGLDYGTGDGNGLGNGNGKNAAAVEAPSYGWRWLGR